MTCLDVDSVSPTYNLGKLLKSVLTPFIKTKNCCLISIKISLRTFDQFKELHFSNDIFLPDSIVY